MEQPPKATTPPPGSTLAVSPLEHRRLAERKLRASDMGDNNRDHIASDNGGCIATPAGDRDRLEPPHRNSVTRKAGTRFAHRVVLTQRHHERGTPDAISRQTLEITFFR